MFAAPHTQTASSTISTLCSRLSSATLLEDRRAAILGLRSFAKEYPASVASDSLRDLIAALGKDGEDVETVKLVLETLLMLFNPNENSPEASEEIKLWMADEFTQRQENITALLDLLETTDFYSRLYPLKLLSAILAARTERTEECIFTAPLGISRLVAVLDDQREMIRNEGLSLLTYLTPTSAELQKLVAFENAFDRIFNIVKIEGSLTHGGAAVEDCLILLANLLRLNSSNQAFFRETGCVRKLADLLVEANRVADTEEIAEWAQVQRNRNIYALLAVIRLFLVPGGQGTLANQTAFCQHGVLDQVLHLAFSHSTEMQIKAEALTTCADLIRANSGLQEAFAQLQVTSVLDVSEPKSEIRPQINGSVKVYVIDGLLDLMLGVSSLQAFDARLAACECIKAYFYKHPAIRLHFLRRAIEGHLSGADEREHAPTTNVLTCLLRPLPNVSSDPYRIWFASVILFHLLFEDLEAKALAMRVSEGDAQNGEELVTCIQMLTANLITSIQRDEDERVLVAYLMLLCGWLFEDIDGVSDFLSEGSNITTLIQAVLQGGAEKAIIQGLSAFLLGTVYEFSTKDSPVSRSTLHEILQSRMGRDQYIDRLTKLRSNPLVRDFEVLPRRLDPATGSLPDIYFDKTFIDFAKDNYSRVLRSIDQDPGFEVAVVSNGVQKGISREMVDSLRSQLEEKEQSLQRMQAKALELEQQLGQEQVDHRKSREIASQELAQLKATNESLKRDYSNDVNKLRDDHNAASNIMRRKHEQEIANLRKEHEAAAESLQRQLQHVQRSAEGEAERIRRKTGTEIAELKKASEAEAERIRRETEAEIANIKRSAEGEAERIRRKNEAEIADLKATITSLQADIERSNKSNAKALQTAQEEFKRKLDIESSRVQKAEQKTADLAKKLKATEERTEKAELAIKAAQKLTVEKEEERQAAQSELEDLLMVIGDLEEKMKQYKSRLKSLGESVSDGEDEDEDEEDEEGADEDEDEEEDEDEDEEDK